MANDTTTPVASEPSPDTGNGPSTTTAGTPTSPGLEGWQIGVVVTVVIVIILIAAIVAVVLIRRKKRAARPNSKVRSSGGGVYSETTAPIDDETDVMIHKSGDAKFSKSRPDDETLNKPSEHEPTVEANESQAALVQHDGNVNV